MSLVKGRCLLSLLCVLVLTTSGSDYPLGFDEITFLNPPEEPVSGYLLRVLYSCSEPAVVHLEALVSSDTGTAISVFQRHWICAPGPSRIRTLALYLPDSLVYRDDWCIPESEWVLNVMLHAWTVEVGSQSPSQDHLARTLVQLPHRHPYNRPLKDHQLCPRWDIEILWRIHKDTIPQCPREPETAHFLSLLFASTGEKFGITRTVHHYVDKVLEFWRVKAISFPWCSISAWLFLVRPCRHRLCGVLHHVDLHSNYTTPTVFLTSSGQLHIQVTKQNGESAAFLVGFHVPLRRWCQIHIAIRGREVEVTMVCTDALGQTTTQSAEHTFGDPLHLDDTEGYFVLGGSQFVSAIEGFFGPCVYFRNRVTSVSEAAVPEPVWEMNLTGWFQSCQKFQEEIQQKVIGSLMEAGQSVKSEGMWNFHTTWVSRKEAVPAVSQCKLWEAPTAPQRRHAVQLAQILTAKHGSRGVKLKSVGRALYLRSLHKLTEQGLVLKVREVVPRLLQAGCLGSQGALYLASVLYNSGLGVRREPRKARQLCLLAAQQDWRLALLHLGHLHHLGEQDIPPDPALAYAYYSNMAAQTTYDRQNPSPQQKFVESIPLNNDEALKVQTSEKDDLFLWLKLQARRGVAEAEQAVGRMLFWGQQGVSRDVQAAVKHYERGAVQLEDTVSMYDYAIVLLKGQGVKQDIPKALRFLKKAAERNFAPAITALGWYYEHYERDYGRAVELWERADALGSAEAAMNLGVMHWQGLYPGRPADQFTAYTYYLKSAKKGHMEAAVQLGEIWVRGIPGRVSRRPLDAVLWAKWVSEQNGHLGAVLRTALDAYLRQDWSTALLWFLMAAESGFSTAQFNVAYLCEHNAGGFLDHDFVTDCMWRFYNLSTQSQDPAPYALVRMGDLFYDGHPQRERDVSAAAQLYKEAALRNNPQGWYSLGLLAQEGETLSRPLLAELGLQQLQGADNHTVLSTLYRRCRDHAASEAYLPCSLALFHAYLRSAWSLHGPGLMLVSSITTALIFLSLLLVRLGRPTARQEDLTRNEDPETQAAST